MHALDDLRDMCMNELLECSKKGELSTGSLDVIDKLAHTVKCIDTIIAMEESAYSHESGYSYSRGRYAPRDSMGRYSNRGSYDNGRDMPYRFKRGYSRGDAKEDLIMSLNELRADHTDPNMVRMIDSFIKQAEE